MFKGYVLEKRICFKETVLVISSDHPCKDVEDNIIFVTRKMLIFVNFSIVLYKQEIQCTGHIRVLSSLQDRAKLTFKEIKNI